jgi:general nucleoside transport system permease protein
LTFGMGGAPPKVPELGILRLPLLSDIPWIGEILFVNQTIVFVALLCVPLAGLFLYHTTWGLAVRYVGENPLGAEALGTRVFQTRYLCVIASGILAALGGSILTLGQTHLFQQNLTAGRGYVALAAVIFGRWNPYGILLAVLLFGFADALQLRIQGLGLPIPYEIPVMFPYILTILCLIIFRGRASGPASLGEPYLPE